MKIASFFYLFHTLIISFPCVTIRHVVALVLDMFQADVIVALAGSNGGSWSTTFSPKSTVKLAGETHMPGGEVETGNANNMALLREYRGRLSIPGSSNQGVGFGDRMPTPTGNPLA